MSEANLPVKYTILQSPITISNLLYSGCTVGTHTSSNFSSLNEIALKTYQPKPSKLETRAHGKRVQARAHLLKRADVSECACEKSLVTISTELLKLTNVRARPPFL